METPGGLCKPSEMEGLGILWASIDPRLRWAPHLKPDWCRTFSREVPVPWGSGPCMAACMVMRTTLQTMRKDEDWLEFLLEGTPIFKRPI